MGMLVKREVTPCPYSSFNTEPDLTFRTDHLVSHETSHVDDWLARGLSQFHVVQNQTSFR